MANNPANGGRVAKGSGEMSPRQIFAEGTLVEAAIRDSMRDVRTLHKKMGVPLVGVVDGKLVAIPPEEIQIDDPPEKEEKQG